MRKVRWKSLAALGVALVIGPGLGGLSQAHEGHDHGAASHGGTVAKTKHYQFEVVFAKDGLKVYPYGQENKPLDGSRLAGTSTFYHPNTPKPWFSRPLRAASTSPGLAPASLDLSMDLSKVPARGAKVAFEITGLPDPAEPTATFTVPFALSQAGEITVAKATQADEKAIASLKVCPVSGEDLGSMGPPLKVSRGDRSTFICCKGCLKKVQADPDKYLSVSATSSAKGRHDHHDHTR
ncbi:MAG: hypothetical protein IRY99_03885 [Isosphaeraceae bacterium]|nr:hypothetical protein [Isosphaeraceae bacterium]